MSRHATRRFVFSSLAAALLAGCGGGGSPTTSSKPTLSLSASAATIAYGDPVTVSWASAGITSLNLEQTNVTGTDTLTTGSLVDHPAGDTTYTITGGGTDGKSYSRSLTVHVVPSSKRLWVIGDQAIAGMPQITAEYQKLTNQPIQTQLTWPASATPADVVILFESANIGTSDQATVHGFLAAGGRVVLVGKAPSKLATGDTGNGDLSSIGAWCFGATGQSDDGFGTPFAHVVASNPGMPLTSTVYEHGISSVFALGPVAGSAKLLTTLDLNGGCAFMGYEPPIGGKLGMLGAVGVSSTEDDRVRNIMAASVIRWVADGS